MPTQQASKRMVNISWSESLPKTGETHFAQDENIHFSYNGAFEDFELQLPHDELPPEKIVDGPKFCVSTPTRSNFDSLSKPRHWYDQSSVIDPKPNRCMPRNFLSQYTGNANGQPSLHHHFQHDVPSLLLQNQTPTSPNHKRRKNCKSMFQRGVTVAPKKEGSKLKRILDYISSNIGTNTKLLLPLQCCS